MDQRPQQTEVQRNPDNDAHRLRNGVIWTVALLILLLAVGLAVPDLRGVLERVTDASPWWLILGVVLEVLSCLGYVATVRLVLSRGPAREVRWLAWAEMAFGAVVPVGGAGGLAVGAWAMNAWRIDWSRIINRSAVIFLLTSAVNAAVLALAGFGLAAGIGGNARSLTYSLLPGVVGAGAIALFMLLPRFGPGEHRKGRVAGALRRLADWVADTEEIAFHFDWRLLGTIGYLVFDIAVLWACMRAVGVHPPILALVVGYQIGYLSNLLPVPGGVGVLEGGLLGALLLFHFPAGSTAAAVVIYHAIALWVPTLGGVYGFARLRRIVSSGAIPRPAGSGRGPESAGPGSTTVGSERESGDSEPDRAEDRVRSHRGSLAHARSAAVVMDGGRRAASGASAVRRGRARKP